MATLKALAVVAGFIALYGAIDWFAGVTAPVLGPIILLSLIVALVTLLWKMVR